MNTTKGRITLIAVLIGILCAAPSSIYPPAGYIPGGTDVAVADGGTGSSTAANARTALSAAQSGANADITSISNANNGATLVLNSTNTTPGILFNVVGVSVAQLFSDNSGNVSFYVGSGANTLGLTINSSGYVVASKPMRLKNYTVATLPAGTQGDTAYVTDALAPTFLATVVGGGAVVTPVFYNGSAWVGY